MYFYSLESAKLLYKTAEEMGLRPQWLNDYGLFEVTIKKEKHFIFHGISRLNTQLSAQFSRHKHLTRIILERYNLPNIPYIRSTSIEEIEKFIQKHGLVVAKPVLGSGSRDIYLIESIKDINNIILDDYIFEKFIKGKEMRYLVFKDEVIAVHEKSYKGPINDPKTVKRVSFPKEEWDSAVVSLALKSAKALSLQFATVDFLIDENRRAFILEINSAPGLYFFQYPTNGPSINIAKLFLEETVKMIENETNPL